MYLTANGIRINYDFSGPSGRPVVVLSHSLASSLKMWEPQMEALRTRFRVLRYDTRGHGKTEVTPAPYSLALLGGDAIAMLDALAIDQAHWVGLSLGGMIGQNLALTYPGRLQSLTLCDTTALMPPEMQPVWDERIAGVTSAGMSSQLETTMTRWFNPSYLAGAPPFLELIKREFLDTPPEGYVGCAMAIRRLDYLDRLDQIKTPTLVMVGKDDPATPVAASQAIHERIAGSKLIVIPEARHLSNVDQAEDFNNHLLAFLRAF